MKHRYLISYSARTGDGHGVFSGHVDISLDMPLSPGNLTPVLAETRRTCPVDIAAPWITSIWKFEG